MRWNLQESPRDFLRKLTGRRFHFAARHRELLGHTILPRGDFRGCSRSRFSQYRRALIQESLARRFLLPIDLRTGLPQRVLILFNLLSGRGLCGLRRFLCPRGPRFPLRHDLQERLEKNRAENQVKGENDQDCGHSLKEQFSQLANNFLHLECVACTSG